ncbi:MAG: ABC transporter ATP-binding protein, partial [Nitrospirales bacterium]
MSTGTGDAGLTPAYRVQDLWFRYPGRSRRASGLAGQPGDGWVVQTLDFEVRAGEVLGITGPNGSGKTTLLKLLSKILRATSGRIELFGREVGGLAQNAVARTVALVPQDGQTLFPFTVAEMVLMGRYPYHQTGGPLSRILGFGWESAMDRRLACQAMEETDVAHLAHRSLAEISGGERQRAVIARALAQDPD